MRGKWLIAVTLLIAGCNNVPAFRVLTPQEASSASTDSLCEAYGDLRGVIGQGPHSRDVIRSELTRRGAMSDQDWEDVAAGRVRRGMGKCTVLAMYGSPTVVSEASNIESMALASGTVFVGFQNGTVVSYTGPPQ